MLRIIWSSCLIPAFYAPVAALSQSQDTPSDFHFMEVDAPTAKSESQGGVVLHFGNGFPVIAAQALTEILQERGYSAMAFLGGPENQMVLCIDGGCLERTFDSESATVLTQVVDHLGSHLLSD